MALPARSIGVRLALQRARASGALEAKPPAQIPPAAIELEYARLVRALVMRAARAAYADLLRELPALLAGARARRGDGDQRLDDKNEEQRAREAVRKAKRKMERDLGEKPIRSIADRVARDTDRHNRQQLNRQIRAVVPVDIIDNDGKSMRPIIDGFLAENVALIQDLTPGLASRIEATVLKALTTGQTHDQLERELQAKAFGYAEQRAELIAIDQIGKLYGQINIQRMRDLGITEFEWVSAHDERVRGNPNGRYKKAVPSHWHRHGKTFAIANPPLGRNGEREYPGTPVRCRCTASPVLSSLPVDLPDPGEAGLEAMLAGEQPRPQLSIVSPAPRLPVATAEQLMARAAREAQIAGERVAWEANRNRILAARAGIKEPAATTLTPRAGTKAYLQSARAKLRRGEPLNGHERIALFEAERIANQIVIMPEGEKKRP